MGRALERSSQTISRLWIAQRLESGKGVIAVRCFESNQSVSSFTAASLHQAAVLELDNVLVVVDDFRRSDSGQVLLQENDFQDIR